MEYDFTIHCGTELLLMEETTLEYDGEVHLRMQAIKEHENKRTEFLAAVN